MENKQPAKKNLAQSSAGSGGEIAKAQLAIQDVLRSGAGGLKKPRQMPAALAAPRTRGMFENYCERLMRALAREMETVPVTFTCCQDAIELGEPASYLLVQVGVFENMLLVLLPFKAARLLTERAGSTGASSLGVMPEARIEKTMGLLAAKFFANCSLFVYQRVYLHSIELLSDRVIIDARLAGLKREIEYGMLAGMTICIALGECPVKVPILFDQGLCKRLIVYSKAKALSRTQLQRIKTINSHWRLSVRWKSRSLYPFLALKPKDKLSLLDSGNEICQPILSLEQKTRNQLPKHRGGKQVVVELLPGSRPGLFRVGILSDQANIAWR
jgi:hypothetical protein